MVKVQRLFAKTNLKIPIYRVTKTIHIMRVRQGVGEPSRIYVLIPGKEDAALAWYLKAGKAQPGVGKKRKETAESHQWWKGVVAPVEAAYPKGTDAPALHSWRYAGKFSARAGTPDRWWCHGVAQNHFSQAGHAGIIEKTAGTEEARNPLVY